MQLKAHIFIWLFCKLGGLFICCCCYYNDAIKRVRVRPCEYIHPFIIIYHWTTFAIKLTETWKDMQFNQIQTILRTTRNTSVSDTMSRHVIHSAVWIFCCHSKQENEKERESRNDEERGRDNSRVSEWVREDKHYLINLLAFVLWCI